MGRIERITYQEWKDQLKNPEYGVYVITGKHHWKQEFMAEMKNKFNTDYIRVEKGIKDELKKLNYRPMGRQKHLLFYESLDRIDREDMQEMVAYVRKPSKYGILVISIDTWADKKEFLKNFKYIESSTTIKLIDLDFPSKEFVTNYMLDVSNRYKIKYKNKDAFNYLFRRLYTSTSDIIDNIQTLSTLDIEIDKEAITTYTEDYSTYSYDQLYRTLAQLNRKRVPYVSYNDLVESGKKEISIMINVRKHFNYLYQAKYLKLAGILRNDDIIELKKSLYDKGSLKFGDNNIFDLSDYKINYYLKESDSITLKDIIYIISIIDKNMPDVTERALQGSKKKKADNTKEQEEDGTRKRIIKRTENIETVAFKTIIEILGRNG